MTFFNSIQYQGQDALGNVPASASGPGVALGWAGELLSRAVRRNIDQYGSPIRPGVYSSNVAQVNSFGQPVAYTNTNTTDTPSSSTKSKKTLFNQGTTKSKSSGVLGFLLNNPVYDPYK